MPPNVLVTGSAGHLGTALMLSLPTHGLHPVGIDILPSPTTTHVGTITSPEFISSIFAKYPTITHVIHAATLHKPHVDSHTKTDFVSANIQGTLVLLEEAARLEGRITSFIFISTTSTFGRALSPGAGKPAVWIDESVVPIPKNIYGVTKVAAEDLCHLVHSQTRMPVLVLRTSRFFPEDDDDEERRAAMGDDNLKVLELCYRRVDVEDVVSACVCAARRAPEVKWGKYIISAPPPFDRDESVLARLNSNAGEVMREVAPGCEGVFAEKGWKFLERIDRVYDSGKAVRELGWEPRYTFARAVEGIATGGRWKSELTDRVGKKGYHAVSTGVYTVR
ncbi:related to UDPglucose 4-epimerase [Cephalotrichum gorgonifer]|uniref:Related to UDPglucose 4-epimerase n=1 Tax=Cephalotrichum gorgonifer TaxID=2041049 RepID=A0AAE8N228_9PEZI|nr:related to UDPglucose 4-epimerase [Cephalotrichum gorgonifer]